MDDGYGESAARGAGRLWVYGTARRGMARAYIPAGRRGQEIDSVPANYPPCPPCRTHKARDAAALRKAGTDKARSCPPSQPVTASADMCSSTRPSSSQRTACGTHGGSCCCGGLGACRLASASALLQELGPPSAKPRSHAGAGPQPPRLASGAAAAGSRRRGGPHGGCLSPVVPGRGRRASWPLSLPHRCRRRCVR